MSEFWGRAVKDTKHGENKIDLAKTLYVTALYTPLLRGFSCLANDSQEGRRGRPFFNPDLSPATMFSGARPSFRMSAVASR